MIQIELMVFMCVFSYFFIAGFFVSGRNYNFFFLGVNVANGLNKFVDFHKRTKNLLILNKY